jgi:hypothetical protein
LLNDERYNTFLLLDPSLDLMNLDPTFITPIAIILINYFLMSRSAHPFLVHLRQRRLEAWNLAFMGGLLFVPLPLVIVI